MTSTLGEKIRQLRLEKNLTLDQLATLTGSSKSYIWELENRNPPRPSAEKLAKIASVLGTTLEYFMDMEEKVTLEDSVDAEFYRKYRRLRPVTKERIRKTLEVWGDDEDT